MIAACGQMEANTIDRAMEVWPVIERLAGQAARARADLLVLPETTYPAYWLESPQRYWQSDVERSARVLERFSALAAKHRLWLVAGFVEEQGERLYNSAAVLDRTGRLVHVARKNFLWDCDNRWFAAGEEIRAFDSEFGRIGVLICADCRAPEISASLVCDGARLLVLPTAWVNASRTPGELSNVHPEFLVEARAREFGVPFVCCSKSGWEGAGVEYVGQSRIVSVGGELLAAAPAVGEQMISIEIELPSEPRPVELSAEHGRRLASALPARRAERPGPCVTINVSHRVERITEALRAAGGRVGGLVADELRGFQFARVLALDGNQVLIARAGQAEEVMARARATENRVFVIVADDQVRLIAQPDGRIAWRAGDRRESVELDLEEADRKRITPQTDIWEQRRVASYRLTGQRAACAV